MKQILRSATLGALLLASAGWAAADTTVLGFDDIGSAGALPALYGGVNWAGSSWVVFDGPQAPYTPHSGEWRVATDFGSSDAASAIRFVEPSVFVGAWFSGFSDATVTVQMYLGGTLVATSPSLAPAETPSFLASGYAGLVDRLVFTSPQQAFYAMDDFTFEASPVPEPQAWLMLATGFAGLALRMRRR